MVVLNIVLPRGGEKKTLVYFSHPKQKLIYCVVCEVADIVTRVLIAPKHGDAG